MVTITQLREFMKEQIEEDKTIKTAQVEGDSLEDALRQASIELGLPVKRLEYEVIQRGNKGVLGFGKKEWLVTAYEVEIVEEQQAEEEVAGDAGVEEEPEKRDENKPGEVYVRLVSGGVFLKVIKPHGDGTPVTEEKALQVIAERGVTSFDSALVSKVVKKMQDEYERIGDYEYNPVNDPIMSVDITDQEMKAFLVVSKPGPGGSDLSYDEIVTFVKSQNVIHGIKEEAIRQLEEHPQFGTAVFIAEGTKPQHGKDAKTMFNFKTDHTAVDLKKDKNGRVDFKELNLVENVIAGQLLAQKTPPDEGKDGRTVTGRILPARSGKDIDIGIGKNVKLAEDGQTVISEINGQVLIINAKINVEPVYTVAGDVSLQTGNILFLGTVIVKGSVEDGFSVKASGNIEVMGSVGKCVLDSEGDIVVHQGILGKNGGHVRSGKSIFAKFIEHSRIEAGENVVASDGIIHSHVDANKTIICQGKRAAIVGGMQRAAEEIQSKTLGSVAGTETILEVGYDPKNKEKLVKLESEKTSLDDELEEVQRNVKTLETLKKTKRKLSDEKETYLKELHEKRSTILSSLEKLNNEIGNLSVYLSSLKTKGRISASGKIFPGVKIFIKNESLTVRTEYKLCSFVLEKGEVKITKYKVSEEQE